MRALLASMLLLGACRVTATFDCTTSMDCREGAVTGVCEANHACAFADTTCASGLRYDELASDQSAANQCVGAVGKVPGCETWHPHFFMPCDLPAPLGPFTLQPGQYVYDTDSDVLSGGAAVPHASTVLAQGDGSMIRVLSVTSLTVPAQTRVQVTGSLPLIVASWSDITVAGLIDAGSSKFGTVGGGAGAFMCEPAVPGMDPTPTGGSGGGGGGGYQGAGGKGGNGDKGNTPGGAGGGSTGTPKYVRAGCPGERSGAAGVAATAPALQTTFAPGGLGGGAVQLAAKTSITISGIVFASGSGGGGAPIGSGVGGGGGGSGGFVGLDAPTVDLSGYLLAVGGGGGGGGFPAANPGSAGQAGSDVLFMPGRIMGGQSNCGGGGGDANNNLLLPGTDGTNAMSNMCGGGGGGGGGGYTLVWSPAFTSTPAMTLTAPPVIVNPL